MSEQQPPNNPYGAPGEQPPPSDPYGAAGEQPPSQAPSSYGQGAPPYGQQPQSYGQSHGQPYGQPYGQPGYGAGPAYGGPADKRPGTVMAAAITTIVCSALVLTGSLMSVLVLAADRDGAVSSIEGEIEGQPGLEGISAGDLAAIAIAVLLVTVVWCLAAIVTAAISLRRHSWARIVTVISAAVTAVLSLIAILSIVSFFTLVAAVAVIVLYFTGGANQWYSGKGGGQQQAPAPPPPPQPWG